MASHRLHRTQIKSSDGGVEVIKNLQVIPTKEYYYLKYNRGVGGSYYQNRRKGHTISKINPLNTTEENIIVRRV